MNACEKNGWKFFGKTRSCYKLMNTSATWLGASNKCWLTGALLVTVGSVDENKFVYKMAPPSQQKSGLRTALWLGYRRSSLDGWIWVDQNKNPYTNWDKGQPDNKGGSQFCAHLRGLSKTEKWDDLECTETKKYVCKAPVQGKVFGFTDDNSPLKSVTGVWTWVKKKKKKKKKRLLQPASLQCVE